MSLDRPYGEARLVVIETTMPWDYWQATLWLLAEARRYAEVYRHDSPFATDFPWEDS